MRAWKSLHSLQDYTAAKSWLITILRRENARHFERRQFDLTSLDDKEVEQVVMESTDPIEMILLRQAMADLPIGVPRAIIIAGCCRF
jgi:RNA polymerase sigma-70 factor (ECF subfamily)